LCGFVTPKNSWLSEMLVIETTYACSNFSGLYHEEKIEQLIGVLMGKSKDENIGKFEMK
jgi:hypothetical protein